MERYLISTRRSLHKIPEVGFDLGRTLAFVKGELDSMGIRYTEKYGKSSIVAYIGSEASARTLAIRADMDALPITEENDLPYKSARDGFMHACGHDAHVAIALDAARRLKEIESTLTCSVRIIFQAAEEHTTSGAKLMADDGVMDGVDMIVALHVDPTYDAGCVGISAGRQNAISYGFYLDFFGKSVHVAKQPEGIDAIRMAADAYTRINALADKYKSQGKQFIFSIGKIEGGTTNNIVCDKCRLFGTLRSINDDECAEFDGKMRDILRKVALSYGGKAELVPVKFYPLVINDEVATERAHKTLCDILAPANIIEKKPDMIGEDFAYFLKKAPGCMIRLGVRNESLGLTHQLHTPKFNIDESALQIGSDFFVNFVLNNMKG